MADPIRVPQQCALSEAIAPPDKVKMLVIGGGGRKAGIAARAASVAQNGLQPGGFNARLAIWITRIGKAEGAVLDARVGPRPYPDVAVLRRDNVLSESADNDGDNLDAAQLELFFLDADA
jgi:hypothetical protein